MSNIDRFYIDRELRHMDLYMRDLESRIPSVDGVMDKSFISSMKSVVEEWDNYTKPLLESLQQVIENK